MIEINKFRKTKIFLLKDSWIVNSAKDPVLEPA